MKKIFVFSLAAVAMMLTACNKEINTPVADNNKVVKVSAGVVDTKAYGTASGKFLWQKNDKIGIWTGSEITPFSIDNSFAGLGYAEFSGTVPAGGAIDGNSVAFYPYNEEQVSFDGSVMSIEGYAYWDGSYPTAQYYFYSTATPEADGDKVARFHFHHLTAYFRVPLKNVAKSAKALFIECWCPSATDPDHNKYLFTGGSINLSEENPTLNADCTDWMFISLPEHTSVIESMTLVLPIIPGYNYGNAKFRIVACTAPSFGNEMDGCNRVKWLDLNPSAGDWYSFPEIVFPNEKSGDDSGSGVNDGIEDSVVNEEADDFWKIG